MQKLLVFVSFLVLMTTSTDTSPILTEKDAKQILRTRREDRPRKAGFPDEPMRYILLWRQKGDVGVSGRCGDRGHEEGYVPRRTELGVCQACGDSSWFSLSAGYCVPATRNPPATSDEYMLYLQRLEQRSEEQFLEHWLNPHCLPHCNRDLVHPV